MLRKIIVTSLLSMLMGCTVVLVEGEIKGISVDTDNHDESEANDPKN